MMDREIEVALVNQFMSKTYRLIGKRDGKPFPLQMVSVLPTTTIKFGYEREHMTIHPKSNVMLSCWQFGHTQQWCLSSTVSPLGNHSVFGWYSTLFVTIRFVYESI
jgi:hypothetical protein